MCPLKILVLILVPTTDHVSPPRDSEGEKETIETSLKNNFEWKFNKSLTQFIRDRLIEDKSRV